MQSRQRHAETGTGRALAARWPDRLASAMHARRRGGRRSRLLRRLAALLLFLAAGVAALARPDCLEQQQCGQQVLVAAHDMPAGATVVAGDLSTVRLEQPPDGAATSDPAVVGRVLSGAMRRGEALTDARVVGDDGPDPGPGRVAVPVRPDDPATVDLLSPGMHVAVIAVGRDGTASTLAGDAVVLAVPGTQGQPGKPAGRLVVLSVPTDAADLVAAATLTGAVTLRFA